jgi:mono/diheme cytochrome c family protein
MILLWVSLAACSSLTLPPTPTLTPLESQGRGVFDTYCSRCHGTNSDTVVVGPSLRGIATRAGTRVAGLDAEAYIRDSILNPAAYTVDGFPAETMPRVFKDELAPEELDAVIAFLLTLK